MVSLNIEGHRRNNYYLSQLIHEYSPIFIFIQKTWLSHNDANKKLSGDFPNYNFLTTSQDMYINSEDLFLMSGPIWHGTAIGWLKSIDMLTTKLNVVSERFCGVKYCDKSTTVSILLYTVYLPTSGKDDLFLEILSLLEFDIKQNKTEDCTIVIGID